MMLWLLFWKWTNGVERVAICGLVVLENEVGLVACKDLRVDEEGDALNQSRAVLILNTLEIHL